jgi:hypothetical protein
MNLTVEIPDDLAGRLSAAGGASLSRRALEAFAADEYRHDRLNKPELQQLLGIPTSYDLDGFLKAHDIFIEYTREDAERERQSLHRLGL